MVRREILQNSAPNLANSVFAYRAGYTAQVSKFIMYYTCKIHTLMILGYDVKVNDKTG